MADARSMCDRITPPKMVPCALVSFGSRSTLMAGIRADVTTVQLFFKAARMKRETRVSFTSLARRSSERAKAAGGRKLRVRARKSVSFFQHEYRDERARCADGHGRDFTDACVERARRERAVRGLAMGERLLLRQHLRASGGPPDQGSPARHRPEAAH